MGLEPKKKPDNPLSHYVRRKELTYTEQLEYQKKPLKRELLEKEVELLRLKKRMHKGKAKPPKGNTVICAEIHTQTEKRLFRDCA